MRRPSKVRRTANGRSNEQRPADCFIYHRVPVEVGNRAAADSTYGGHARFCSPKKCTFVAAVAAATAAPSLLQRAPESAAHRRRLCYTLGTVPYTDVPRTSSIVRPVVDLASRVLVRVQRSPCPEDDVPLRPHNASAASVCICTRDNRNGRSSNGVRHKDTSR